MKKVISIISPQWGTAGTDINLLKIAEGLINEEFDVRLLIVGDEWFDKKIKSEIKVVYLIPRYIFKFMKRKYIPWRITMILSVIFSIFPLIFYLKKNNGNYILGLVPILAFLGFLISNVKPKIIFSIQGLPRSNIIFNLNLFLSKFLPDVNYVIPTKSMSEYLDEMYNQSESIEYEVVPFGKNSQPSLVAVQVRGKFLGSNSNGSSTISKLVEVASTVPCTPAPAFQVIHNGLSCKYISILLDPSYILNWDV